MSNLINSNQMQWLQGLQSFLNNLLTPIIKDKTDRNKYLDKNAMGIWSRAFTHETVSPSDNYEDLEFLGDAILKAVFPKYLMKRLPHLHKGEYTELNVAYMSKIMQAQLSRKLGLGNYIRVTGIDKAILNLETDVFESFFGALDTISDNITPGLGFANCYNMILYIFKDVDIDETKAQGSAKTQVIQMFVRFDLPKPVEQSPGYAVSIKASPQLMSILNKSGITNNVIGYGSANKEDGAQHIAYGEVISLLSQSGLINVTSDRVNNKNIGHIDFTVSLRKEHIDFLRSYGVNINNYIIGSASAPTKKESEFEAYSQALQTLAQYGITTEWAEEAKQSRDFADPYVSQYLEPALSRLHNDNFVSMYFFIPRKTVTPKGAIVQLVGVKSDGSHEVLSYTYTNDSENSYRVAKTTILQQYASGK